MGKRNLPQPFEIDKIRFKDCFTAPSLRHFGVLITGWVLTVGVHTISQVILTCGLHESESFVSIYRFLQKAKWAPDQVAFEVFRMIVETLLPGETELGAELIRLTRSWLDPGITLRVIVDGGYSNKQLLQGRAQGVHVTGKVRMDAALYAPAPQEPSRKRGRPRKKGERLPSPRQLFHHRQTPWEWIWISLYGQETIVEVYRLEAIWYNAAGNEPLSVVLVRDPAGKYPAMAFFDTDTGASDKETIQRYTHRWSMEITNRETKGLLGSADAQCRSKESVLRAPLMAYWSYCLVAVWFVTQYRMGKDLILRPAPWYAKKHITFSDMLAAARRSHFAAEISRDPRKRHTKAKITATRSTRDPLSLKRAKL